MTARILALTLLWPSLAFGQAGDFTIKADDEALIFPTSPPGMGSLAFTTAGESCYLDELFAASDAMMEFLPLPSDETQSQPEIYYTPAMQLRIEADRIERMDAAIKRWREIAAKCSRIYRVVRDGAK